MIGDDAEKLSEERKGKGGSERGKEEGDKDGGFTQKLANQLA